MRQPGLSLLILLAVGLAAPRLADAQTTSGCKLVQIADLPVRFVHNKLIVDGAINGHKIGIMLDTGATYTVVPRPTAIRLELPRRKTGGLRMFGVGGETQVEVTWVDAFEIGEAKVKNFRVLVAGEHELGDDAAMLLGEDFFHLVDVEFDLAHNAVRLFQPVDCEGVSLAYWTPKTTNAVTIEAIDDSRPRIVVPVQINGKPVRAILDSGAGASTLDKPEAARLGVTQEAVAGASGTTTGMGPKLVDWQRVSLQSFAIGDDLIKDPTILVADLFRSYAPVGSNLPTRIEGTTGMLLGADFLRAYRLLVAHSQQKIYFSYVGGPVFGPTTPAGPAVAKGSEPAGAEHRQGAVCQYSSQCLGDLRCVDGKCRQRTSGSGDQCSSHADCPRDQWCIGLPRRCQPQFAEGMTCEKDSDCLGALTCLADRCSRHN